ncbi:hypothetical protein G7Y89_g6084 [Cudoniella acicularis]|uniref:BTB domain-containing protein n=1 Tax=Cudoniella acicularis TaxID=354080 RepID=A0A8H4RMW8_9HELO|nr:hypothetical protein G7Y89_g6084 [Cudoniella acicularis]
MSASFQEILNSRLFKFTVGEAVDGKPSEFSVHEDAIAQLSAPLRTLTKSSTESRAGRATWKEVSKDTFERFVQYAYTGDYSIPKTEKRNLVVPPKVNGFHPKITAENGTSTTPSSPAATNGIRGRVNSLGSDGTATSEVRDGSISEKLEEDGTILNYPIPNKKHKKKKAKAALAAKEAELKAEKEAKDAELKTEKESVEEPEPEQQAAEPLPAEPEPAEPGPEPEQVQTESTPLAGQENLPVHHVLTADFKSLSFPLLASRDNYEGTCEPSTEFAKDHSYSNVFLSHASLYILGDVQIIDNLKALALFKLHKTLCTFELMKKILVILQISRDMHIRAKIKS